MSQLPDDLYRTVTESLPIVCVDVIPVRKLDGQWQIGVITRATGSQAGKLALIGGRIRHGESIEQAIKRHLNNDLLIKDFRFFQGDSSHPFNVAQYEHVKNSAGLFDPTKHSVALTYLIEIDTEPKPKDEASDFHWLSLDELPKSGAFNQQIVMNEAFKYLT